MLENAEFLALASFQNNAKQSDNQEKSETPHEVSSAQVSAAEETTSAFKVSSASDYRMLCCIEKCVSREPSLIPDDEMGLPPLLMTIGENEGNGCAVWKICSTFVDFMCPFHHPLPLFP